MITLQNIILRRGQHVLLENVNWTIYHRQRIGLIGANGSGKTSLFSLLLGELEADAGECEIPRGLKLAHVAQETPGLAIPALDYVLEGDTELQTLQQELTLFEEKNDGENIANCHARMGEIDAYTAPARAAQLLNGLGFNQQEQQQLVSSFSGGFRVRLNLAKALMMRSDVLLLDEPTNHLDLDAIIWLENWLMQYHGTLLLISHDREFLDRVVDHIAHISHQQLKCYTGNYSTFEKQRAMDLRLEQSAYEKQQKQIAHLKKFIDRFKAKASKARQAQSRIKAIERMDIIHAVQMDSPFHFQFKDPGKSPNPMVRLEEAVIAYGDHIVLKDVNMSISYNDRIALIGPNGAGKSTFIKTLAGEITPANGMVETSAGVKIGYFAQHQIDHLHLAESPLDHMRELAPNAREQELRTYLGSFGFTAQRVHDAVHIFSGGEKSRLALSLLIWQKPNLLLLDEPTNHLDLEMRHALSMALQEYEGAMVLVSHDRFLVRSTADQLMLVAHQAVAPFEGDLSDYERWLFAFRKQNESDTIPLSLEKQTISRQSQRQLDAEKREQRRPLLQTIKKCERDMEELQNQLNAIEKELSGPTLYDEKNKSYLHEFLQKQAQVKKQLQETETIWLNASQQCETHPNEQGS